MTSGVTRLKQHRKEKKSKEAIYTPKLSRRLRTFDIDKNKVCTDIVKWHGEADEDRAEWKKDYNEVFAGYYGKPTVGTAKEDTDLHIPLSMYHVEKKHASISEVLWGMNKVIVAKPNSEEDLERTEKRGNWMNWELKVHMNQLDPELGVEAMVDKFSYLVTKYGNAVGMVSWIIDEKFMKESRIHPLPPQRMYRNRQTGESEPLDDENIKVLFLMLILGFFGKNNRAIENIKTDVRQTADYVYRVDYTETRKVAGKDVELKRSATCEFFVDDDNVEMEVSHMAKNYEGAQVTIIPLEDILFSPDIMYKGIQRCKYVIRRFWQSKDDVLKKIQTGEYEVTEEDKKKLDEYNPEAMTSGSGQTEPIKKTKDTVTGTKSYQSLRDLETLQGFCLYDVDKDDFEEDVVFTIIKDPQIYLQGKYLSQIYRHNKRPFFDASYGIKEDGWYTWGALKMLQGVQDATDIMWNQRNIAGSIANNPFGFYDPTSGLKPETIHVRPGDLIPLPQPQQSVYFPSFPNASQVWGFNEEALLNQYAERLMAQGDLSFARTPQKVGALRTWGAVRDILSQAQQMVKPVLKRIKRGLEEMVRQIDELNYHYMAPGLMFRVMGEDKEGVKVANFEQMTREELATRPDYEMPWNIANLDDELRRVVSIMMIQTLVNPVLIQLGIVTPEDIYNAHKNFLEQHDEVRPELYISKPKGMTEIPVKDPDLENKMMAQGDYPQPSPAEEHQQHLIAHQGYVYLNKDKLDEDRLKLFQTHLAETQALLRKKMEQQQLIQNAGMVQNQLQAMGLGRGAPGGTDAAQAIPATAPMNVPPGEGRMTEEMG